MKKSVIIVATRLGGWRPAGGGAAGGQKRATDELRCVLFVFGKNKTKHILYRRLNDDDDADKLIGCQSAALDARAKYALLVNDVSPFYIRVVIIGNISGKPYIYI